MKKFLLPLLALVPAFLPAAEPSAESDIFGAIHANDIDVLKRFIADDPASATTVLAKNGMTPLHYAAHLDRVEAANLLLKAGADPNAKAKDLTTPLHWAAGANSVDVLRFLLANRAVADAPAKNGLTPLHMAARTEAVECIVRLVEAGVDPNIADEAGNTPLHEAALKGRKVAAAALIARGADPERANARGERPIDLARDPDVRAVLGEAPAAEPAPAARADRAPAAPAPVPAPPATSTAARAFDDPNRSPAERYADFANDPATTRNPDGTLYNGERHRGKFDGFGIHVLRSDGERYVGNFHRGRRQGHGVYYYANGDVLDCEWDDDVPDGPGTFSFAGGGVVRGTWRNGVFLRGEGTFSTGSGSQSYGIWEDGHLKDNTLLR